MMTIKEESSCWLLTNPFLSTERRQDPYQEGAFGREVFLVEGAETSAWCE